MSGEYDRLRRAQELRTEYMPSDRAVDDDSYNLQAVANLLVGLLDTEQVRCENIIDEYKTDRAAFPDKRLDELLEAIERRAASIESLNCIRSLIHGFDHPIHNLRLAGASQRGRQELNEVRKLKDGILLGWYDELTGTDFSKAQRSKEKKLGVNQCAKIAAEVLSKVEDKTLTASAIKARINRAKKWNAPQFMHDEYARARSITAQSTNPQSALFELIHNYASPAENRRYMLNLNNWFEPTG